MYGGRCTTVYGGTVYGGVRQVNHGVQCTEGVRSVVHGVQCTEVYGRCTEVLYSRGTVSAPVSIIYSFVIRRPVSGWCLRP